MQTDTGPIHLDDKSFGARAGTGLAMIDFWAPWCPPCRALSPTIDSLASEYQSRVTVGKVDIDQSPQTAQKFGVQSIPTVVMLRDGKEVGRVVGLKPRDALAKMLDSLLTG